jgi:c-di-GMP-binding flagellar brake protein YcgR
MTQEKRKFVRVNYPCSVTLWHSDGTNEVILANTANISAGGLCVYLNRAASPGTRLDLRIDNFFEGNPLKCAATVVRCREDEKTKDAKQKFYEVGVEFNNLNADVRQYIEGFVRRTMDLETYKKDVDKNDPRKKD